MYRYQNKTPWRIVGSFESFDLYCHGSGQEHDNFNFEARFENGLVFHYKIERYNTHKNEIAIYQTIKMTDSQFSIEAKMSINFPVQCEYTVEAITEFLIDCANNDFHRQFTKEQLYYILKTCSSNGGLYSVTSVYFINDKLRSFKIKKNGTGDYLLDREHSFLFVENELYHNSPIEYSLDDHFVWFIQENVHLNFEVFSHIHNKDKKITVFIKSLNVKPHYAFSYEYAFIEKRNQAYSVYKIEKTSSEPASFISVQSKKCSLESYFIKKVQSSKRYINNSYDFERLINKKVKSFNSRDLELIQSVDNSLYTEHKKFINPSKKFNMISNDFCYSIFQKETSTGYRITAVNRKGVSLVYAFTCTSPSGTYRNKSSFDIDITVYSVLKQKGQKTQRIVLSEEIMNDVDVSWVIRRIISEIGTRPEMFFNAQELSNLYDLLELDTRTVRYSSGTIVYSPFDKENEADVPYQYYFNIDNKFINNVCFVESHWVSNISSFTPDNITKSQTLNNILSFIIRRLGVDHFILLMNKDTFIYEHKETNDFYIFELVNETYYLCSIFSQYREYISYFDKTLSADEFFVDFIQSNRESLLGDYVNKLIDEGEPLLDYKHFELLEMVMF